MILTTSDYTRLVEQNRAYTLGLSTLFSARTLLFIGYGLQDKDLRLILHEHASIFKHFGRRHFALVADPGTVMSRSLEQQLNIHVIPYSAEANHVELLELLKVLKQAIARYTVRVVSKEEQDKNIPRQFPYKFLDFYDTSDRDLFFGRERETGELTEQIRSHNLLVVFGQSGSGKTSIFESWHNASLKQPKLSYTLFSLYKP